MTVSFELDDKLEALLRQEMGDVPSAAREALLIHAYRLGKISVGRLAQTLGMGVIDAEDWLSQRRVPLNYSLDDFQADMATLRDLRGRTSP